MARNVFETLLFDQVDSAYLVLDCLLFLLIYFSAEKVDGENLTVR